MLENHIQSIQEGIRAGIYANEASICQGIVTRLLQALGWPTFDVRVVFPEYPLNTRRVDFALCHPPGKALVIIEVKLPGKIDAGERQLFEYAFHKGVPMAILTDGQEWHFFLPGEPGDYTERRVYMLDLVNRPLDEVVRRFKRYLKYQAVCSGESLIAARADYQDVARTRQIKDTLPDAVRKLIEEEDSLLLEIVAERVERICGYKPDLDTVAGFLKSKVIISEPPLVSGQKIKTQERYQPPDVTQKSIGFTLNGVWHPARSAREVMVKVFTELCERDPSFPHRFASLPKHGRKRHYLTKNREELYPNRPDLARDHSVKLPNGWWLGINESKQSIQRIIIMACQVASLRFGQDLIVNLGD
ncbi:MAG: hypothetical protein FJ128_09305 [Deltaproteobacteria bacterium]|nr:hypothetical protein [Deltaproteobacteria bacterium]